MTSPSTAAAAVEPPAIPLGARPESSALSYWGDCPAVIEGHTFRGLGPGVIAIQLENCSNLLIQDNDFIDVAEGVYVLGGSNIWAGGGCRTASDRSSRRNDRTIDPTSLLESFRASLAAPETEAMRALTSEVGELARPTSLYVEVFGSSAERALALERFVAYYNDEHPHLGIDGQTPRQRLAVRLAA